MLIKQRRFILCLLLISSALYGAVGTSCWDCDGQTLGDANGDGIVDIMDFAALGSAWQGQQLDSLYHCCSDFNQNGEIDENDLIILTENWLTTGHPLCTEQNCQNLPDLIVFSDTIAPLISYQDFEIDACPVQEGCVTDGYRKLLRFKTETHNVGPVDLVMGDPTTNPLFEYHPCHDHYHFEDYAVYRLYNQQGQEVVPGFKFSFCLLDTARHDPTANPTPVYDCDYHGIQAGWGDVYSHWLDCQWLDITNVPPGTYTLEIEINPDRILPELDYFNNFGAVTIDIP